MSWDGNLGLRWPDKTSKSFKWKEGNKDRTLRDAVGPRGAAEGAVCESGEEPDELWKS